MAKREEQNQNDNTTTTTSSSCWGTWEELLLASAVKRHGFKNWDTVALELQSKSSLPHLFTTAQFCQQKYLDLHRRFTTTTTTPRHHHHHEVLSQQEETRHNYKNDIIIEADGDSNNNNNNHNKVVHIPWLEELRKLRVAELKQEVQRYDVSILSLQLKVKRLKEERQRSFQDCEEKPDLKQERSENVERQEPSREILVSVSGEESDRENRSVNESNSTGSGGKGREGELAVKLEEAEPVRGGSDEPDPVMSGSNMEPVEMVNKGEEEEGEEELGDDSVSQLSSESLSSARKRKRKGRKRKEVSITCGGSDDGTERVMKSEPLVGFLDVIRAHKQGPLFEGLLQSQETEVYKNMVRQHMDLETIQTKLEQGFYYSSNLSFYRDLLLLFNNAIVFFPKSTIESLAANELRSLVSNEIRKEAQKSDSTILPQSVAPQPKTELEGSDSLLAKHKSSIPIIASRKRSSISTKPSSSSLGLKIEHQQQGVEDKPVASDSKPPIVEQGLLKMKSEEKPVTGARSSRRGKKNIAKVSPNKKQNTSPDPKVGAADKPETLKTEKKKTEGLDKKQSAVNFLKRIKKNSPAETSRKNNRGGNNGGGERKKDTGGKGEKGKERVARKSGDKKQGKHDSSPSKKNIGRPSKKGVEASRVSGKRRRESGSKEAAKRPGKRARR